MERNEYRDLVLNLQSEDPAWLVEYLDSVSPQTISPPLCTHSELVQVLIGISDPASLSSQESLHKLRKICGVKQVLPKSCTLSGSLLDAHLLPASGSVYEGTLGSLKVRILCANMYFEGRLQKAKGVRI